MRLGSRRRKCPNFEQKLLEAPDYKDCSKSDASAAVVTSVQIAEELGQTVQTIVSACAPVKSVGYGNRVAAKVSAFRWNGGACEQCRIAGSQVSRGLKELTG
ncbi:hypothetical protein D3C77_572390 [compost metagenome]